jgi:hypothetical protein
VAEPHYVGWRGELLAEVALRRVAGLEIHKPHQNGSRLDYDFLVSTPDGFCFFVEVKAFSSMKYRIADVAGIEGLLWTVDGELIRNARKSQSPFVLFLFDADSEHGRFLRLDTLPDPPARSSATLQLPIENTITPTNLRRLIASMQHPAKRAWAWPAQRVVGFAEVVEVGRGPGPESNAHICREPPPGRGTFCGFIAGLCEAVAFGPGRPRSHRGRLQPSADCEAPPPRPTMETLSRGKPERRSRSLQPLFMPHPRYTRRRPFASCCSRKRAVVQISVSQNSVTTGLCSTFRSIAQ